MKIYEIDPPEGFTASVAFDPEGYIWDEEYAKSIGVKVYPESNTPWMEFMGQIISPELDKWGLGFPQPRIGRWDEYDAGCKYSGPKSVAQLVKKILGIIHEKYGRFDLYCGEVEFEREVEVPDFDKVWLEEWTDPTLNSLLESITVENQDVFWEHLSVQLNNGDSPVYLFFSPADKDFPACVEEELMAYVNREFPGFDFFADEWHLGTKDCCYSLLDREEQDSSLAYKLAEQFGYEVIVP